MNPKSFLFSLMALCLMVSCGAPKAVSYFQDAEQYGVVVPVKENHIRLRPEDKISIVVNTSNDALTSLFNLPYISQRISGSSYSSTVSGYTVDGEGNIDFPVLGKLHVAGLTRAETAAYIKQQLVEQEQAKEPVVTVEFMNLTVSVMGEVSKPGRYSIDKDKLTLLDVLSMAGDLTIYGNRENIKVFRQEEGREVSYKVDLCSVQSVMSSPAYYIQQDDLVYVEPNDVRARQSTVNGNNIRSTSFWISVASLATSVATFVLRFLL